MQEEIEEAEPQLPRIRAPHIRKRALKNKALSVGFNEKDLRDFITGFHKRKKKRRKEAQRQQEEAKRRKRIEERKKRRLEREFALYGGAPPEDPSGPGDFDEDVEENEEQKEKAPISGSTTYENGEMTITVTTSEISREEESHPSERLQFSVPISGEADKKHKLPVTKKKSFKKNAKRSSGLKPQNKKSRNMGKRSKKH